MPTLPSTEATEMTAMQVRIARLGHILDDVDVDGFEDESSDSQILVGGRGGQPTHLGRGVSC